MKQMEIAGNENTRWTCVEAYSMMEPKTLEKAAAKKAAEISESEDGKVTVICTPAGGSQNSKNGPF